MIVKELIAALQKYDENLPVVISKDGEGNSFSPLSDTEEGVYEPESTWCGQVYAEEDENEATEAALAHASYGQ